jgi:hypothetical protein
VLTIAMQASTAFPPLNKALYPARVASCWLDATIPWRPMATDLWAKLFHSLFRLYENSILYLRDYFTNLSITILKRVS